MRLGSGLLVAEEEEEEVVVVCCGDTVLMVPIRLGDVLSIDF